MTTLSAEVRDRLVRILRPGDGVEGHALGLALLREFDTLPSARERIAALAFVLNNYSLIEFAGEKTHVAEYPSTDRYAHGGADHALVARAHHASAEHLAALQALDGERARTDPVDDALAARVWEYLERLPSLVERAHALFDILKYSLFMQIVPLPASRHGRGSITEEEVGRAIVDRREHFSAVHRCFLMQDEVPDDLTRGAALLDIIMSLDDPRERAMLFTVVMRILIRITTVKAGSDAIREYIAQTSGTAATRH